MWRSGALLALATSTVDAKAIAHEHNAHTLQTDEASGEQAGPDTAVPSVVGVPLATYRMDGWCRDWREGSTNGTGLGASYFSQEMTIDE